MTRKTIAFATLALLCGVFFGAQIVDAAPSILDQTNTFNRNIGFETPTDIRYTIALAIRVVLSLLGMIFLAMILYAGFTIMTAAGEQSKVDTGKNTLKYAVIGMVIVFSSYGIAGLVTNLIGQGEREVDCFYDEDLGGWYFYASWDIQEDTRRFQSNDPLAPDQEFKLQPCPNSEQYINNETTNRFSN
jgi:hypothetical protein